MGRTLFTRILVVGLIAALPACSAITAQREAEQAKQQAVVKRMDTAHVFVTTGEIDKTSKPYTVLGELKYTEPFSADAIDAAKMKERLKQMANQKYPDQVDAVISAKSDVNDQGTQVTVSAQAIKFESSVDREAMHHMTEGAVASPK
jgi:cytochrome c556